MATKVDRRNKLIRNVDHNVWTKTVKRARREEGLEANALIEKLFGEYNASLDLKKAKGVTTEGESPVQVLD